MANSVSVTSLVDRRNLEPHTKKIWEIVSTFVIEAGGGATEISHTVPINGLLREATIQVGDAGGITGTVNVDFDDADSVPFDTNNTLGEGSKTLTVFNLGVGKPVNNFIIRLDPSDDPTAGNDDWEIIVTCRGD